ncbi:hypothetical protein [Levilactobacillus suantsaii]|nr:hypothetical protein [Levilactobacillus suantsaii]
MFIQEPFGASGAYAMMVKRDYQFLSRQIENKGQVIKGDID